MGHFSGNGGDFTIPPNAAGPAAGAGVRILRVQLIGGPEHGRVISASAVSPGTAITEAGHRYEQRAEDSPYYDYVPPKDDEHEHPFSGQAERKISIHMRTDQIRELPIMLEGGPHDGEVFKMPTLGGLPLAHAVVLSDGAAYYLNEPGEHDAMQTARHVPKDEEPGIYARADGRVDLVNRVVGPGEELRFDKIGDSVTVITPEQGQAPGAPWGWHVGRLEPASYDEWRKSFVDWRGYPPETTMMGGPTIKDDVGPGLWRLELVGLKKDLLVMYDADTNKSHPYRLFWNDDDEGWEADSTRRASVYEAFLAALPARDPAIPDLKQVRRELAEEAVLGVLHTSSAMRTDRLAEELVQAVLDHYPVQE